jgi:hypothetical protein
MLLGVALIRTDVLDEYSTSIIRVTRISELCSIRQLLVTANIPSVLILVTLMMEALHPSETSVLTRAT